MRSVTLRTYVLLLLLLLLTPSFCPNLPTSIHPALAVAVWPVLPLAALKTPKATTPQPGSATPATLKSPIVPSASSPAPTSRDFLSTLFSPNSTSASSAMSPSSRASPGGLLMSANSAATSTTSSYPATSPNIFNLQQHPCKHLQISLKSKGSPPHKCHVSSKKHMTGPFPPPDSTSLPKPSPSSSPPPTTSHHHPSSASMPVVPSTSKTRPPSPAKASPIPLLKTSPKLSPPSLPHTVPPLFEDQPFIVTWNIPDLVCNRYNISLDTSPFKGVATPAKVPGQFLSLFYTDRLGLYPHVDLTRRKQLNGGIPQRANLRASVNKARSDINYYIPSKTSRGLAVIDWEEWRPLWDRNWGTKRIYQTLSVAHVMHANQSLTEQQATEIAIKQFQAAARGFMSGMLAMGRAMRPNYLWGFYLFPNCYNYGWEKADYTGRCSEEVRKQNDQLLWLWESSSAFFPSVYLQVSLADSPRAPLMVRNRVQEALRVSAMSRRRGGTAPVFVYTRPVFVDQNKRLLSQGDLVSTIGESAAVGAAGAVLWGASADYDDQMSCEALSSYLSSTLNPYVTNVTVAAQLCSYFLCRGNGRCVRKNYNSNHYLHLNPGSFRVLRVQGRYLVLGRPTLTDLKTLSRRFTCQCYKGLNCSPRTFEELSKALMFTVKQGKHRKAQSLNKAMLDDTQQTSISKDKLKNNFKV